MIADESAILVFSSGVLLLPFLLPMGARHCRAPGNSFSAVSLVGTRLCGGLPFQGNTLLSRVDLPYVLGLLLQHQSPAWLQLTTLSCELRPFYSFFFSMEDIDTALHRRAV